jgi:hypothetical protein
VRHLTRCSLPRRHLPAVHTVSVSAARSPQPQEHDSLYRAQWARVSVSVVEPPAPRRQAKLQEQPAKSQPYSSTPSTTSSTGNSNRA